MGQHYGILDQSLSMIKNNKYLVDWVKAGLESLETELIAKPKIKYAFLDVLKKEVRNLEEKYEWYRCWLLSSTDDREIDDDFLLLGHDNTDEVFEIIKDLLNIGYYGKAKKVILYTARISGNFLTGCLFEEFSSQFYEVNSEKGLYIFNNSCENLYDKPLVDYLKPNSLKEVYTWDNIKTFWNE